MGTPNPCGKVQLFRCVLFMNKKLYMFGLIIICAIYLLGCGEETTPYVYQPSQAELKRQAEHEELMKKMDKTIEDLRLARYYMQGYNSGFDMGYEAGYYKGLKDMKEIMEGKRKPLVTHPKK